MRAEIEVVKQQVSVPGAVPAKERAGTHEIDVVANSGGCTKMAFDRANDVREACQGASRVVHSVQELSEGPRA